MKKLTSILLALCLGLALAACGGPSASGGSSASGAAQALCYTYQYQGMMGPETALFELAQDGSCRFSLQDNPVIQDVYQGSYTREGDLVTITGLTNEKADAEHPEPGLWDWIAQGGAVIRVNDADGTFVPEQAQPAGDAGQEEKGLTGVAYAELSPSQVCDIYLPEGEDKAPVIVLVHGGGFAFGDAKMPLLQPVIQAAQQRGYAVVSVDYRKSGEAVFPAALADVKAAVRFVKANAEEYGFDSDRVAVWGESAGAYLALMTALTPDVEQLNGEAADWSGQTSAVQAFVAFYPPVEFYTLYQEAGKPEAAADSFESKFLGQDISADEALTYTTYWETYADQLPADVYAWIQAGDGDDKVPCSQSANFAQRLAGYIGQDKVSFGLLENAGHEDPAFYTEENLGAVLDWLDGVLGR